MKIKKDSLYLSFLLLFIIWYDNIKQKGENMDNKYDCELIHFNLCLGCTRASEKEKIGLENINVNIIKNGKKDQILIIRRKERDKMDKKLILSFLAFVLSIAFVIVAIINLKNMINLIHIIEQKNYTINELKYELEYNNYVVEDSLKQ